MYVLLDAPPWWVEKFTIPAFFTLLGAGLGLIIGKLKDSLEAKRAEHSFKNAIGFELDALFTQLEATERTIDDCLSKLQSAGSPPHLAGVVRRTVFSSQLGKLRDVDDPLLIEIIHFYSDLGTLEQIFASVNQQSAELARVTSDTQRVTFQSRVNSALLVLKEESRKYRMRIKALRSKLPSKSVASKRAETP